MDLLALLHERLTGEHPVKKALERLHAAGEPNPLFALGELALARLEDFSTYPTPISGTAPELEESRFEFSAEERAEIANALRTKEHLIRSGFYDETADGLDVARWAGQDLLSSFGGGRLKGTLSTRARRPRGDQVSCGVVVHLLQKVSTP